MFRTALPFGYLFIALFFVALFVAGAVTFAVGRRWRLAGLRWVGAGLCVLVVAAVVGNEVFDAAIEWNPVIVSDVEVTGTWTGSDQTITLAPDHTFTRQEAARTIRGTWVRNDWNLSLYRDGYTDEMRFIQFGGTNRLLTYPLGDPDAWDGDLGLRRAGQR